MKNLFLVLAIAVSVLLSSSAFAGTKDKTATIKVKNNTTGKVGVIVDPKKTSFKDEAEFKTAGGKILNAGETATFTVKAGTHTVGGGTDIKAPGKKLTVTVKKGDVKNINFSDLK